MLVNVQVECIILNGVVVLLFGQCMVVIDVVVFVQVFVVDSDVDYVEFDYLMQICDMLSDLFYNQQWYLFDLIVGIDLLFVWNVIKGLLIVVMVVFDIGYWLYGDFVGNLLFGYSFISNVNISNNGLMCGLDVIDLGDWVMQQEFDNVNGLFYYCVSQLSDSSWYGMCVMGVIGVIVNNGIGIVGVLWFGQILLVCVFGKCGGVMSDIVDGMCWVVGILVIGVLMNLWLVKIINLSFGGVGVCSMMFQQVIDDVIVKGVIVVVVVGNDGLLIGFDQFVNCCGVIIVGVIDVMGCCVLFSNFGVDVVLSVLGVNILLMLNIGMMMLGLDIYGFVNGISFVMLQVMGVVVLMLLVNGNFMFVQILQKL